MATIYQNPSSSRSAELEEIYTGKSLFLRARVDRVLRALAQEGSMTMREFTDTAQKHPSVARELVDHLVVHHMIRVTKHRGFGSAGYLEIQLTPEGHAVVDHLEAIHRIIQKADNAALPSD